MSKKIQVAETFNTLLKKSAPNDWEALAARLEPQHFAASSPSKSKGHLRLVLTAGSLAAAIAVTGLSVAAEHDTAKPQAPTASIPSASAHISPLNGLSSKAPDSNGSSTPVTAAAVKPGEEHPAASSSSTPVSATQRTRPASSLPTNIVSPAVPITPVNPDTPAQPDTSGSKSTGPVGLNLPMMPAEPQILDYSGRLYITNSVFGDKEDVTPGDNLGTIDFGGSVPVYAVKDTDAAASICLLGTYKSDDGPKEYYQYDYLCPDSFTAQGGSYRLEGTDSGGSITEVTSKNALAARSARMTTAYELTWEITTDQNNVLDNIKAILDEKIASPSDGTDVYSIDEIDPSQAVYLNIGDKWFLATKSVGYTGKTVDDVMKDKGLTSSVSH